MKIECDLGNSRAGKSQCLFCSVSETGFSHYTLKYILYIKSTYVEVFRWRKAKLECFLSVIPSDWEDVVK